ncbi:little elongation complex subunit 2 isoform X2 [Mixophyes fleayi]|uniref:little elongation complex subunit 2 isoform X2 n=1 Tax=Mixophyes fleayi TaxID=3061075 RepID=UPI003F4DE7F8
MEAAGELRWDIEPYNGRNNFFTRESYDKYCLGPSLAELLLLSNKPAAEEPTKLESKAPSPQPPPPVISAAKSIPFPEPRVPYPRCSSLTALEQDTYVKLVIKFLNSKNTSMDNLQMKEYNHYQFLKSKLNSEHADFQKFLHNAARSCAEDYNVLCAEAALYIQEMLKACQACVKDYPELYTVHEITSISGGKFIPDLSLKLEKCLLKLGSVKFVKITFPTDDLSLPTSYKKVSRMMPPVKKAARVHASVSSDPNISNLASKYCPQVVLTTQALFTLLNNHGPDYSEQWEIPVRVETNNGSDSRSSKIVYLDSPLPKKLINTREKNQMFHEVLLDQFLVKNSFILLKYLSLDKDDKMHLTENEVANRRVISDSNEVDFDNDVTELETFGSIESNTKSFSAESDSKSPEPVSHSLKTFLQDKLMMEKQINNRNPAELGFDSDEINKKKEENIGETSNLSSDTEIEMETSSKSMTNQDTTTENDSGDERLVIDIDCKKSKYCNEMINPAVASAPIPSQQLPRKSTRKISKDADPVGQILKMQKQLLKPATKKVEQTSVTNPERNEQPSPNTTYIQQTTPLVSNTFQDTQRVDNKKSLLRSDLLAFIEDETAYTVAPNENCTYKLFSLDDVLLLIKSTIQTARTRSLKKISKKIPCFLLTKVDYQTCYGVESLTESESCRLWTESLLHSNCLQYVGHVDALTSKFFMLEEVTAEKLKEKISIFKPANCLNTLHHILKWVTGLQDGSYLLSHMSGDSSVCLYKSVTENKRGTYNLHDAHINPPKRPSFVSVPWVPLNPNLLLNYHIKHGRPPCTFPPAPEKNIGRTRVNHPIKAPSHEKSTDLQATNVTTKLPGKKKGRNRLLRLKKKQKMWKAQAALQRKT